MQEAELSAENIRNIVQTIQQEIINDVTIQEALGGADLRLFALRIEEIISDYFHSRQEVTIQQLLITQQSLKQELADKDAMLKKFRSKKQNSTKGLEYEQQMQDNVQTSNIKELSSAYNQAQEKISDLQNHISQLNRENAGLRCQLEESQSESIMNNTKLSELQAHIKELGSRNHDLITQLEKVQNYWQDREHQTNQLYNEEVARMQDCINEQRKRLTSESITPPQSGETLKDKIETLRAMNNSSRSLDRHTSKPVEQQFWIGNPTFLGPSLSLTSSLIIPDPLTKPYSQLQELEIRDPQKFKYQDKALYSQRQGWYAEGISDENNPSGHQRQPQLRDLQRNIACAPLLESNRSFSNRCEVSSIRGDKTFKAHPRNLKLDPESQESTAANRLQSQLLQTQNDTQQSHSTHASLSPISACQSLLERLASGQDQQISSKSAGRCDKLRISSPPSQNLSRAYGDKREGSTLKESFSLSPVKSRLDRRSENPVEDQKSSTRAVSITPPGYLPYNRKTNSGPSIPPLFNSNSPFQDKISWKECPIGARLQRSPKETGNAMLDLIKSIRTLENELQRKSAELQHQKSQIEGLEKEVKQHQQGWKAFEWRNSYNVKPDETKRQSLDFDSLQACSPQVQNQNSTRWDGGTSYILNHRQQGPGQDNSSLHLQIQKMEAKISKLKQELAAKVRNEKQLKAELHNVKMQQALPNHMPGSMADLADHWGQGYDSLELQQIPQGIRAGLPQNNRATLDPEGLFNLDLKINQISQGNKALLQNLQDQEEERRRQEAKMLEMERNFHFSEQQSQQIIKDLETRFYDLQNRYNLQCREIEELKNDGRKNREIFQEQNKKWLDELNQVQTLSQIEFRHQETTWNKEKQDLIGTIDNLNFQLQHLKQDNSRLQQFQTESERRAITEKAQLEEIITRERDVIAKEKQEMAIEREKILLQRQQTERNMKSVQIHQAEQERAIHSLKNRLREWTFKCNQQKNANEQLMRNQQGLIREYKEAFSYLSFEQERLGALLTQLEKNTSRHVKDLKCRTKMAVALRPEITQQSNVLVEITKDRQNLQITVEQQRQMLKQVQSELYTLHQHSQESSARNQHVTNRLQELIAEKEAAFQNLLNESIREKKNYQHNFNQLSHKLNQQESLLASTSADLNNVQAQLLQKTNQLSLACQELTEYRSHVERSQQETQQKFRQAQTRNQERKREFSVLQQEMQKVNEQRRHLHKELAEMQTVHTQLSDKFDSLSRENGQQQLRATFLTKENKLLANQVQSSRQEFTSLQEKFNQLQSSFITLKEENGRLSNEIPTLQELNSRMQIDLERFIVNERNFKIEFDMLKNQNQADLTIKDQTIANLQAKTSEYRARVHEQKAIIQNLTVTINNLKEQEAQKAKENALLIADLNEKLMKCKAAQLQDLKSTYDKLSRLEARKRENQNLRTDDMNDFSY